MLVDWYSDGLYGFSIVKEGELELTKKTADGELTMNFPVPKGALEFVIEQNWRENGAVLTQVNGPLMQPLGILFAQVAAPTLGSGAGGRPAGGKPNIRTHSKRPCAQPTSGSSEKRRRTAAHGSDVSFSIDSSTLQSVIDPAGLQLNFTPKFRATT